MYKQALFGFFGLCTLVSLSYGQPVVIPIGGSGTSESWTNLSNVRLGFGGFPGSAAWPHAILSDGEASGAAGLIKIANNEDGDGGPTPLDGSIYSGGFSGNANVMGGTLSVADSSPVASLKTIVFQIEIGQAFGYDFYNDVQPVLLVNGSPTTIMPDYASNFEQVENGTFPTPDGDQPIFINTWAFQWDLSDFASPVTSFDIQFSPVEHSQIYALQLDQSDAINNASVLPVPEPSTWALLAAAGAFGLLKVRSLRRVKAN